MTQVDVKVQSIECAEPEGNDDGILDCIRRNEADEYFQKIEAIGIDRCSNLNIFTKHKSSDTGAVSWNMLQWACFHGNEKVSKNRSHLNLLGKQPRRHNNIFIVFSYV